MGRMFGLEAPAGRRMGVGAMKKRVEAMIGKGRIKDAAMRCGAVAWVMALCAMVPENAMVVHAEHYEGDPDWAVSFTGTGMESNFKTADINDAIYNLQPGDSIDISLTLKNASAESVDWWMTNKVLRSLEDTQEVAKSGGYTYVLSYQPHGEARQTLYSSDTVGGEKDVSAGEGLHEAADALGDYFYLDTLHTGEQAYIYLSVALDGETQGNAYQDTLADLTMNFAVEVAGPSNPPHEVDEERPPSEETPSEDSTQERRQPPKTGDETNLMLYVMISLVSGLGLLALALISGWKSKREKRGEAGR